MFYVKHYATTQARHWVDTWRAVLGKEANLNRLIDTLEERGDSIDVVKSLKDALAISL